MTNNIKNNITFQGGADMEQFQIEMFERNLSEINATLSPIMIELGSNDCFYSLTFHDLFKHNQNKMNICVEASKSMLDLGISNVENNNGDRFFFKHARVGILDQAYFDSYSLNINWGDISKEMVTLKQLIDEYSITNISMLHLDIQGSEIQVVDELGELNIPIDFIYMSTHPTSCFGPTHDRCLEKLITYGYEIIYQDSVNGGYGDGLIVCKSKN